MSTLYDYCRWNQTIKAQELLSNSNEVIDVLDQDGIYFMFAVKNNNVDILNSLIQYFVKTQLQGNHEITNYKIIKQRFQEILQDVLDTYDISSEIQNILKPYLSTEHSDSEQKLDDTEIDNKAEEYYLQKAKNNLIFDKEKICEAFHDLCCSGSKESISIFVKNFQLSLDMDYKNGAFLIAAANNNNEAALEFFCEHFPYIYNKYYDELVNTVSSNPSKECQAFLDSHHVEIETSGNIDHISDNL